MSTAPAPDAAGPPGMCPGITVGGGGDSSGNGDGSGGEGGKGNGDGSGNEGQEGANGAQQGAPDPEKYPTCGTASHPVDVVTGRAFTHPIEDFFLAGPLPFRFTRSASSTAHRRDFGLGWTWGHTLGWEIEIRRSFTRVWGETGVAVDFPRLEPGQSHIGQWGWLIRREVWGYSVDADDGVLRIFSTEVKKGRRYKLTAVEDRNKNRIVCVYDETGKVLREVHDSAGRIIQVRSDRNGRIEQFLVKNAPHQGKWVALATYTHDFGGDLTSFKDADDFTAHYEYDSEHRLVKDKDRAGLAFHFRFDKRGRCIESWGDYDGRPDPSLATGLPATLADRTTPCKGIHHCVFQYSDDGFSVVIDSTQARSHQGNKHGLIDEMESGGGQTKCTYGPNGHLTSYVDGEGGVTEYTPDGRGHLVKIIDPIGRVTTVVRDSHGLATRIIDPESGETIIDRDGRGNVLSARTPAGRLTRFEKDARGLLTKIIAPNGAVTALAYDAQGSRTQIVQPDGGIWTYTRDYLGRLVSSADPLGAVTRYVCSDRGDVRSIVDPLGGVTHFQYDGERHVVQVHSPAGSITRFQWGGYHRICLRKDANGNSIRLGYDVEGQLTHVWNEAGEVHRLSYSSAGFLQDELSFDGRHIRYKHDKVGRVTWVRGGDQRETELQYDLAGQLLTRIGFDGSETKFSYNLRGELVAAMSTPNVEALFSRDADGLILRETQTLEGVSHEVALQRDDTGARVIRTTSLGHVERVSRDLMGRRLVTELDESAVRHIPDYLGRDLRRDLRLGGSIESSYDPVGRLKERRASSAVAAIGVKAGEPDWIGRQPEGTTSQRAFQYNPDGELTEIWDRDLGRTQMAYDPIGQLTSMVPDKARSEFFRYDARGNLQEAAPGAAARTYGRGNRLERHGNVLFKWDGAGRLVEKSNQVDPSASDPPEESWRYTWNASGLLENAQRSDGLAVEFVYDALGRRLQKQTVKRSGAGALIRQIVSKTRFVWDGEVLVHEVRERAHLEGDPIVEERTYWFEDGSFIPLAHREKVTDDVGRETGGWFHYLNDPIGTPEKLVNERGEIAAEYTRTAWGRLTQAPTDRATTPIRLQGQYWDEETGLSYNRWRYFSPEAQYISPDPVGLDASLHFWKMAPNLMGWIDPFGLAHTTTGSLQIPNASGGYDTHNLGSTSATGPEARQHSEREMLARAAQVAREQRAGNPPNGNIMQGTILNMHNQYDPCPERNYPGRSCQDVLQRASARGEMRIEVTSDQNNNRRAPYPPWVSDRRPGHSPVNPDPRYAT